MLKASRQFGQQWGVFMPRSSTDVPTEVRIDPIELGHNIDCRGPNAARCAENGYVLAGTVVLGMGSVLVQNSVQRVSWRDLYLRNPVIGVYLSVLIPLFAPKDRGSPQLGKLITTDSVSPFILAIKWPLSLKVAREELVLNECRGRCSTLRCDAELVTDKPDFQVAGRDSADLQCFSFRFTPLRSRLILFGISTFGTTRPYLEAIVSRLAFEEE